MKRIQSTLMAALLTVALSSVALGGNIGMRTSNTDDSTASQVSKSGNIGMKSDSVSDSALNILGNIGMRIVFSTSTIW